MRLRIMQMILFFPCCLLDGIILIFINIPMWIVCGTKATTRQPLLEWLFEIENNKNK